MTNDHPETDHPNAGVTQAFAVWAEKEAPRMTEVPKRRVRIAPWVAVCAFVLVCALLLAISLLTGCSSGSQGDEASTETQQASAEPVDLTQLDLDFTDRDQDPSYDEDEATYVTLADGASATGADAQAVSADGQTVIISAEGVYVLSGTLSDGQVLVEADDAAKVQLVLAGVTIHNEDGPAIRLNSGDKAFITLAEGTENTLTDGTSYTLDEDSDEPYATLFSKIDLTLNGAGSLTVAGNYCHAVCSKDDLVVTGGSYTLTSVEDALRGRDCVKVAGGAFAINAGEDAVKSNNDEDTTRGYVLIDGGTFDVTAGDDAFHAETAFLMRGGEVLVRSCNEGYEGQLVQIEGGTTDITATDDGLNAASGTSNTMEGGMAAGPMADGGTTPPELPQGDGAAAGDGAGNGGAAGGESMGGAAPDVGGTQPGTSEESSATSDTEPPALPDGDAGASQGGTPPDDAGQSGEMPTFDGQVPDMGEMGQPGGDMPGQGDSSCQVVITGGTIRLNSGADGIDSNGTVEVSGGVLLVDGPISDGEGALDYASSASISGGVVLMAGSSGMAQSFTEGTQAFALAQAGGTAGQSVAVVDASGTVVAGFTPAKDFACVVVSAPGLQDGQEYQVVVGGTLSGGTEEGGLTTGGAVDGGTSTSFTATTQGTAGIASMGATPQPPN